MEQLPGGAAASGAAAPGIAASTANGNGSVGAGAGGEAAIDQELAPGKTQYPGPSAPLPQQPAISTPTTSSGVQDAAAALGPPGEAPVNSSSVLDPLSFLHSILQQIAATDKERYFVHPVDERGAPNYYSIIRAPMCFSMMQQKLDARAYTSWRSFVADFELIVANARTYNTNKTRCYKCALALQRNFHRILGQHELDIRKAFTALFPLPPTAAGAGVEPERQQHQQHQHQHQQQQVQQQGETGAAGTQCLLGPLSPATGDSRPLPQQHSWPASACSLPRVDGTGLFSTSCQLAPPPKNQPITLQASCGLQFTVPTLGSPPVTAAATAYKEPQPQVLMPPPPRCVPICEHISDDEAPLPLPGGPRQQREHLPYDPPLLPFEALLHQLRVSGLRQPWPADQADSGVAASGPSSASAAAELEQPAQAQPQVSKGQHTAPSSPQRREAHRPLEWQCHWLELRRRELLGQLRRLEVLLQQEQQPLQQQQAAASSLARALPLSPPPQGLGDEAQGAFVEGAQPAVQAVAATPSAPTPAATTLSKQQAQLSTSIRRFLGHAVLPPPPPVQLTITLPPPEPSPASPHEQQLQQHQPGGAAPGQPALMSNTLFYELRTGRAQLLGQQQQHHHHQQQQQQQCHSQHHRHAQTSQPPERAQSCEPMAVDQEPLEGEGKHGAAGTAVAGARRNRPQQQQQQQPGLQGLPCAALPGALFSGFEILQQQVQSVKQCLQVCGTGARMHVHGTACTRLRVCCVFACLHALCMSYASSQPSRTSCLLRRGLRTCNSPRQIFSFVLAQM